MAYAERALSSLLSPLVACTWAFSSPGHAHRVLPDGCIDVVVVGGRARVIGTMRRAIVVRASQSAVLGIRLRPGEAARLFPEAPRELTDADAALSELWHDDGRAFEDALVALSARATRHRAPPVSILERARDVVEQAMRKRLASHGEAVDLRVRAAASLLERGHSVTDVASRVDLSERQLARRFAERVGMAPKAFARVRRLQCAARLLADGASIASTASLAGYSDQAHFTRDSSELAGIAPVALARELAGVNATAIPVAL